MLPTGTRLATRIEDEATLYQLPGGRFVEVGSEVCIDCVRVYAFPEVARLEYCALFVKLPDRVHE